MKTRTHRDACFILATALVFLPVATVAAAETAAPMDPRDLALEVAVAELVTGSDFGLDFETTLDGELYARLSTDSSGLTVASVRDDSWRSPEAWADVDQQSQTAGKKKGKGFVRWLKKRWYVPVLAAVVLGVTLGDDGAADQED